MVNKKSNIRLFIGIVVFMILNITSVAKADTKTIDDKASLLKESEIITLEEQLKTVKELTKLDIVIVTTNNVEGKSSMEYADDYYDYNGYGSDDKHSGILLLINMEDREVWISTTGIAIDYFTDNRIDSMVDNITEDLGDKEYYKGCKTFINDVKKYYEKGIPDIKGEHIKQTLIIAVVSSLALAALCCGIVIYTYKKPSKQSGGSYVDRNSISYTRREDRFITTHTTKSKIETNNSSGGGSSTHTSSSGSSHGGGGGKF